ncbi:pleckstrin homology domain-containing family J member 1-like [Euwallacea fornicatus]|uniref:pleckstrin homology domain-containing family J member 1-like n=1 Tax=Euwallacea fornicatus TaxID=995702 RepID=UPI00338EFF64
MRFNDKEIVKNSEGKSDLEGVLQHMKPQSNEWSDWYQQPSFKERYFKLKANLLFYSRINESEPLGVLVLENLHVAYEHPHKGIPFTFSLTFKVNDKFRDNEAKHVFSCRCEADVNTWVSALKMASYEYWRSQFLILRTKLAMKTGKDLMLESLKTNSCAQNVSIKMEVKKSKTKQNKSTFYSHFESNPFFENHTNSQQTNGVATVENLITF